MRAVAKERSPLTLDAGQLEELRRITGARSLSAAVDAAVAAYLARIRRLASVDEWLAELEREHGPIPSETLDWAAVAHAPPRRRGFLWHQLPAVGGARLLPEGACWLLG